jgi:hypothetical protein
MNLEAVYMCLFAMATNLIVLFPSYNIARFRVFKAFHGPRLSRRWHDEWND